MGWIEFGSGVAIIVVAGLILKFVGPWSRVIYWLSHDSYFKIPADSGPDVEIRTQQLIILNTGWKRADDLEIVFRDKPDYFNINYVTYEATTQDNGNYIIKIESLGRKESFSVDLLSLTKLPVLNHMRSKDGPAKLVATRYLEVVPKAYSFIIWSFLIIGGCTSLYLAIKGTSYLIRSAIGEPLTSL